MASLSSVVTSAAPNPMWHALHLVVRPIEALLGLFCVVTATFLYPGEDGKIQSQLEDVWVQVDDFRDIPVSKHAAFMARVARLETIVLEFMFGNRLFSEQAVVVSLSISFVCAIYVGYLLGDAFGALGAMTGSIGGNVVVMPQITLTRQLYDHRFEVTLALLGVAIGVVAIGLRKSKPFRRRSILGGGWRTPCFPKKLLGGGPFAGLAKGPVFRALRPRLRPRTDLQQSFFPITVAAVASWPILRRSAFLDLRLRIECQLPPAMPIRGSRK